MTVEIRTWDQARSVLRHRSLRQGLYDEGARLMGSVIVNLHGAEHVARRRVENRLFRLDTFSRWEADQIPSIIGDELARIGAGQPGARGELLALAQRTMMRLSVEVAGVDLDPDDADEFDGFHAVMNRLARAATVVHAVGDKQAVIDAGDAALATFAARWFRPAAERRRKTLARHRAGLLRDEELPADVLTTLLRHQPELGLSDDALLKEVSYFPWVGSHSTSNQLVHAMHHVFEWLAEQPADRASLIADADRLQRFVHESMRLHPASPVAVRVATEDVEIDGAAIPEGSTVVVDMVAANRDPAVFGDAADAFDPERTVPDGVPRWGVSFGSGTHACLGTEIAAGNEPDSAQRHLHGAVTLMCQALLEAGARPDPDDLAERDEATSRPVWGRYPVMFGSL